MTAPQSFADAHVSGAGGNLLVRHPGGRGCARKGRHAIIHLDFTRFDVADGGSLAILVSDLGSRTGIYWLTFDDGTEYVGQSIEIVKRLASHRRRQPGEMLTVSFAPVPAGELDRAERWFIGEDAARGTVVHWNIDVPDEAEKADLPKALRRVDRQRRVIIRPHHQYGDPVVALEIPGASLALDVLGLAPVAELAYRFNTRYQRQEMTLQSKGHNPLLEADFLGRR